MTYNKRQKADWNVGKGCKGERKAKERVYTQAEIEEQMAEQDPSFRYRMSRRKRNVMAHLEYEISWYRSTIAKYEKSNNADYCHHLRSGLKVREKDLETFLKNNEEKK